MSERSKENRIIAIGVSLAVVVAIGAGLIISNNRAAAMREEARRAQEYHIAEFGKPDISELVKKPVPDFRFDSTAGRPLGLEDLKGSVWVGAFVFTRCPNNM